MKVQIEIMTLFTFVVMGVVGCGTDSVSQPEKLTQVSFDGSRFLLNEEPDGAVGVIAAKESSEDGAPLVLVGRIGGSAKPWVDGRAAFTLIDASMAVVAEGEDSGESEICTGDCCANERLGCTTLVKFVDGNGQVVPVDARKLLGLKDDDMVVIKGIAKKDKSGNFSMLASALYVRS